MAIRHSQEIALSARLAATNVLLSVERGRSTLAAAIERARPQVEDARDTALLMELASGVTRWRAELDARLVPHLRHSLDTLAPEVRAILRLAAYQLHHLDRVPDHAIVNESVELTRTLGQPRAAGFVNAVLRNLIRARNGKNPLPKRPVDGAYANAAVEYLSITLSHPRWLVERWLTRFGFDACERWCQFNNTAPDVTLRPIGTTAAALVARLEAEGLEASLGRYVTGAVRIGAGVFGKLPPDVRDDVLIQDEGSQLVACAAGATAGERVLDVCAAPGGKTLILASGVGASGLIVAADRRAPRVKLLRETLKSRPGLVFVLAVDAIKGLPFSDTFDRVLLDAPCSGLGTIRRDPDIKWNRAEADLSRFAQAQTAMIANAARTVRPGGSLIYSTCSSEPEENEAVVDAFLAANSDFSLAPLALGGECGHATGVLDPLGRMRTWPFEHGLDAFFAARLVRRNAA